MASKEFEQIKRRVIDAVQEALTGTDWSPPEGGLLTEVVVVGVWMDPAGETGMSFFPATNHWWSTKGLLDDASRMHSDSRSDDDDDND